MKNKIKTITVLVLALVSPAVMAQISHKDRIETEYQDYLSRFDNEGKQRIKVRKEKGERFCSSRKGVASFESGYMITVCRNGSMDVSFGGD
jgi:hypothetical protein